MDNFNKENHQINHYEKIYKTWSFNVAFPNFQPTADDLNKENIISMKKKSSLKLRHSCLISILVLLIQYVAFGQSNKNSAYIQTYYINTGELVVEGPLPYERTVYPSDGEKYVTMYKVYDKKNKHFLNVQVTHKKDENKVILFAVEQSNKIFKIDNVEQIVYESLDMNVFGHSNNFRLFLDNVFPYSHSVKFFSNKFEHLKIISCDVTNRSLSGGNFASWIVFNNEL